MTANEVARQFITSCAVQFFVIFAISGCSDPLNYKVATMTRDQQADVHARLTADQSKLLDDWITRQTQAHGSLPPDATVDTALKDQIAWSASKRLKDDEITKQQSAALEKQRARQEELSQFANITMLSKANKVLPDDRKFIKYELAYHNSSTKEIRFIKALMKLTDIYGEPIIAIECTFTERIPSATTLVDHNAGLPVTTPDNSLLTFWNTDFDKLNPRFEIRKIVFSDGTSVSET